MALSLSPDRTHLLREGQPFFWLADTAWNGLCRATEADWAVYLAARAAQGFTVIQFVCTHWRAYAEEPAFTLDGGLRMNEAFFARRDRLVQMIREHGLVPAPVLLWACTEHDPGWYLSEADAVTVARYIKDRWGGEDTVYFLGGDGNYRGEKAAKWRRIGRAVFADDPGAIVTMHPGGQQWVVEEFRHEPWFGFHGYQSGHGDSEANLRWLLNGPPGVGTVEPPPYRLLPPVHPVINLEPNYELHPAYQSQQLFTDVHVRRAAYWSLLVTPPAGVTYGSNAIWPWATRPEAPLGHEGLGVAPPWHEGLDTPGVRSMTVLRRLFDSLPWWRLRPAPHLLAEQPGLDDPARHVMAAATNDIALAVIYTPTGATLRLNLPDARAGEWFNPRTGESCPTGRGTSPRPADRLTTPDESDWVLVLRA